MLGHNKWDASGPRYLAIWGSRGDLSSSVKRSSGSTVCSIQQNVFHILPHTSFINHFPSPPPSCVLHTPSFVMLYASIPLLQPNPVLLALTTLSLLFCCPYQSLHSCELPTPLTVLYHPIDILVPMPWQYGLAHCHHFSHSSLTLIFSLSLPSLRQW